MSEALRNKALRALELYAEGGTITAARDAIGISGRDFGRALREDTKLGELADEIQRDRAAMMVDEAYAISCDDEKRPGTAHVQATIRLKIAALYDRQRFGDKLDLSIDAGPSVVAAIAAAKSRLPCDLDAAPIAQVIDAPYVLLGHATDKQSVALSKEEFFGD